jgi:hypothetical protein
MDGAILVLAERVLVTKELRCSGPVLRGRLILSSSQMKRSSRYRGPFSRCILESPGFGRNGYRYVDKVSVNAQCYRMRCKSGKLYVIIDGQDLECPDEGYIELNDYPDLMFAANARLGPCPTTSDMCGTAGNALGMLECPFDCSGHGLCLQGVCKCHVGYVGNACQQSICWNDTQCQAFGREKVRYFLPFSTFVYALPTTLTSCICQ